MRRLSSRESYRGRCWKLWGLARQRSIDDFHHEVWMVSLFCDYAKSKWFSFFVFLSTTFCSCAIEPYDNDKVNTWWEWLRSKSLALGWPYEWYLGYSHWLAISWGYGIEFVVAFFTVPTWWSRQMPGITNRWEPFHHTMA